MYVEYLILLFNRLRHTQMAMRENLTQENIKSKYYYDKIINPTIYY